MARNFLNLPPDARKEALAVAGGKAEMPDYILEKDVWVVWVLEKLYKSPLGKDLIFKGGTSLSKVHGVIDRFSDDVDLTYDIRKMIPEEVAKGTVGIDAEPPSASQASRWTKAVRERLPGWITETVVPLIQQALNDDGLQDDATINVPNDGQDTILLDFKKVTRGPGYILSPVKLEFGARSTGEPTCASDIKCYADVLDEDVVFPAASCSRIMVAERTFWEKATAIHVYCVGGSKLKERFSRHWYDLVKLDDAGVVDKALDDREIATAVASHKSMFFKARNDAGPIDYSAAVEGGLCLVPSQEGKEALKQDYDSMVEAGVLLGNDVTFNAIMERCAAIVERANIAAG